MTCFVCNRMVYKQLQRYPVNPFHRVYPWPAAATTILDYCRGRLRLKAPKPKSNPPNTLAFYLKWFCFSSFIFSPFNDILYNAHFQFSTLTYSFIRFIRIDNLISICFVFFFSLFLFFLNILCFVPLYSLYT